jgi:hypothetical protein
MQPDLDILFFFILFLAATDIYIHTHTHSLPEKNKIKKFEI